MSCFCRFCGRTISLVRSSNRKETWDWKFTITWSTDVFLPSQFYSRQIKHLSLFFHSTNRLIGTVKFCFQNRKLKDMQVLLIRRLLAIDPELLNEAQFVYMHVSTINFFSLLINYHSFLLNIQHPLNNR